MNLMQQYHQQIAGQLQKDLQIKNLMLTPKLTKIVVNLGMGEALENKKALENTAKQLEAITGQKPFTTRAKRSIATFKLRAGDKIGLKVTLRGQRMYAFLEKLVKIVLPKLRDFRGLSLTAFDGQGNYNIGIEEQTVFPEIDYAQLDRTRGMQITLVTNTKNDKWSQMLFQKLGLPFEKNHQ